MNAALAVWEWFLGGLLGLVIAVGIAAGAAAGIVSAIGVLSWMSHTDDDTFL